MVRTGEQGSSKGISAIVVERGTPGFTAGKKENKLGMRASETTEMILIIAAYRKLIYWVMLAKVLNRR